MLNFKARHLLATTLSLVLLSCISNVQAQDRNFTPEIANAVNYANVKSYGAKGDGVSDDTAAIREAIYSNPGGSSGQGVKTLYFPNGTYLVSGSLEWKNRSGDWISMLAFQGQSQSGTIIRLKDSTFTNANASAPVIKTASGFRSLQEHPDGTGNNAFQNNIRDLTINTGSGNPGAVGIDYIANNIGTMENVTIRSGDAQRVGVAGLRMNRYGPGPSLFKNVSIEGFDYGIQVAGVYDYGSTFEHLNLKNQRVAGIYNENNLMYIRDLKSDQSASGVTAVYNAVNLATGAINGYGRMVIIDANLIGGSNTTHGVQSGVGDRLYVRNLVSSGYKSALRSAGNEVAGNTQAEFFSIPPRSLFDSPQRMLHLSIRETPTYWSDNLANWQSVTASVGGLPGATPNNDADDDAPAIQRAIDAGKAIVFLPQGTYHIRNTIIMRGSVRLLHGSNSYLRLAPGHTFTNPAAPKPMVRFENTTSTVCESLNMFDRALTGTVSVEHAGSGTLTLKNCELNYRNTPNCGPVFFEDMSGGYINLAHKQEAWMRQVNPEFSSPGLVNNGGQVWILGYKTEGRITMIRNQNGGKMEVLGGMGFYVTNVDSNSSVIDNDEASFSGAVWAQGGWDPAVRDKRGGVARTGGYDYLPFYISYVGEAPGKVTGASLWLKADAGTTTDSNGAVSRWVDQSGSSNDATQSNGSRPQLVSNALNGQPVLRFNGSAHFLNLPSGFANWTQGLTAFVVAKPTAVRNWARFLDLGNGPNNSNVFLTRVSMSNDLAYAPYNGSDSNDAKLLNSLPSGEPHLWSVVHQGGTPGAVTPAALRRDGDGLVNADAMVPANVTRTSNYIGKSNWPDDLFEGDLTEVILYPRALNDSDRQSVENYLKNKYGLGNTSGIGLKAEYYSGTNFNTLIKTQTDATVNFNWGTSAPAGMSSVGPDNFSVRWSGQVQAVESGTYTFRITTDDGMRLWVGNTSGTPLIDKWFDQGATPYTATLNLTAGQKYDIKLEYYESGVDAFAQLAWQRPGQSTFVVVPQAQLFPAP